MPSQRECKRGGPSVAERVVFGMSNRPFHAFFQEAEQKSGKVKIKVKDVVREFAKENRNVGKIFCNQAKTRILRCSTLVNPTVANRAKYRGLSSIGHSNQKLGLMTQPDQNFHNPSSKISHLLQFSQPSNQKPFGSRSFKHSKYAFKRLLTQSIQPFKTRCIPKSDLRNLKVAVIGTKLL